jgi:hypothetical protein
MHGIPKELSSLRRHQQERLMSTQLMKKLVAVSLAAAVLTGGAVTANAKPGFGWHGYDHDHGWGYGYGFGGHWYHNYYGGYYGDYYGGCYWVSRPWGLVKVCPGVY